MSFVWGMCLVDAFRGCLVDGWFKKNILGRFSFKM